ncbi:Glu/Leu/Phe/Val dehydrogenase [bacterium]|nr:Glu/Leu/Phe/Val dehydrogenase [bacterium]
MSSGSHNSGIFGLVESMGHEQVVFCHDKASGLKAIIGIHDTTLGPALGGTRMWDYASDEDALVDVLRLSRGMTYKAACAGLNLGGGKAVIIGDAKKIKSEALFRAFGRFVNSLGGRYITAEDVNINVNDIEQVAAETRFVTGISSRPGGSGDPSPVTAWGVYSGIRAAVKHRLGKDSLHGMRVAVQGVGAVGKYLCGYLAKDMVKLVVTDVDPAKVDYAVKEFGATAVRDTDIYSADVDVFAPCALGAIINDETIPLLKAKIVAGGANNQLLNEERHGSALVERNILYAPDYVINAAGLINVYNELIGYNAEVARKQAGNIYHTLSSVFADADKRGIPTGKASDLFAERRIASVRGVAGLRNTVTNQSWSPEWAKL